MNIQSEILPLKKVLVHFPRLALERLTPENCQQYLFDDVLWPEGALHEHEHFVKTLKQLDVEVLFVEHLLVEALHNLSARDYLIERLVMPYATSICATLLNEYLQSLSPQELANCAMGGLTFKELEPYSLGLASLNAHSTDFAIPPLPNLMFTRDSSSWVENGFTLNSMAIPVRRGETIILSTIYKYHPLFENARNKIWYDASTQTLPYVEGGDIMMLNADTLAIGISQRTRPQSIEIFARKLFQENIIKNIVAVDIPKKRSSMHLDTLMTMIDRNIFCTQFPLDYEIRSWILHSDDKGNKISFTESNNLFKTLAKMLGVPALNLIHAQGNKFTLQREQWNDANNLLAVKPGVVIGYEQNTTTNQALCAASIKVIPMPASELIRGRGGFHCMTCPMLRE
jgi:arginine deiminase